MADSKLDSLLDRFARQDRQALARLITHVENRSAEVSVVMERIYGVSLEAGLFMEAGIGRPTGSDPEMFEGLRNFVAGNRPEAPQTSAATITLPKHPPSPVVTGSYQAALTIGGF